MTEAIDAAMAAAQQAAATAPAVPAVAPQGGVPAAAPARGAPMTMDDFTQGAMGVEEWLKVNQYGLTVGGKDELVESIVVDLYPEGVQFCQAIKFGNPATYFKTYDNATCVQGGSWENAIARAQAAGGSNVRPYPSADLCLVLVDDVKGKKGVLAEAGTKLGHSLSTTNRDNFATLLTAMSAAGLCVNGQILAGARVKVGAQKRTNKAGNEWGVLTFELLGAVSEFAEAE